MEIGVKSNLNKIKDEVYGFKQSIAVREYAYFLLLHVLTVDFRNRFECYDHWSTCRDADHSVSCTTGGADYLQFGGF